MKLLVVVVLLLVAVLHAAPIRQGGLCQYCDCTILPEQLKCDGDSKGLSPKGDRFFQYQIEWALIKSIYIRADGWEQFDCGDLGKAVRLESVDVRSSKISICEMADCLPKSASLSEFDPKPTCLPAADRSISPTTTSSSSSTTTTAPAAASSSSDCSPLNELYLWLFLLVVQCIGCYTSYRIFMEFVRLKKERAMRRARSRRLSSHPLTRRYTNTQPLSLGGEEETRHGDQSTPNVVLSGGEGTNNETPNPDGRRQVTFVDVSPIPLDLTGDDFRRLHDYRRVVERSDIGTQTIADVHPPLARLGRRQRDYRGVVDRSDFTEDISQEEVLVDVHSSPIDGHGRYSQFMNADDGGGRQNSDGGGQNSDRLNDGDDEKDKKKKKKNLLD